MANTETFDRGKDWVKSSKNLKLGKQESRLEDVQHELMLQLHAQKNRAKIQNRDTNDVLDLFVSGSHKQIILPRNEYAMVIKEIRTWISKEELSTGLFVRYIGDSVYYVEAVDNGEDGYDFRIIGKE